MAGGSKTNGNRRDYQIDALTETVKDQAQQITNIQDNHLTHLREDLGKLKSQVDKMGVTVSYIAKLVWLVLATSVGALLTALYNSLFVA